MMIISKQKQIDYILSQKKESILRQLMQVIYGLIVVNADATINVLQTHACYVILQNIRYDLLILLCTSLWINIPFYASSGCYVIIYPIEKLIKNSMHAW